MGGAGINGFEAVSFNIFDIDGILIASTDYKKENWNIYRGMENNCFKVEERYYISGTATHPTGDVYNPSDSAYIYIST